MQAIRLRRLRQKDFIRDWVSETQLEVKNFILPYFVVEGKGKRKEINSMSGVYHLSIDNLLKDIAKAKGIKSILLFGIPEAKDELGSQAYGKNAIIQKAIKAIKKEFKDLIVIADVCLCGYISHGHCGLVKNGKIDNDLTLEVLAKIALFQADAGVDFVAPSAMMDGQVKAIRTILDKRNFKDVGILSYSAKYASNFYGPFRDALRSTPQFGDRKSYQADYRNSEQALREIKQDIDEGADIIMVKPALAYLDIIYRAREKFNVPIAAYNVSGEYAMIKKAADGDKLKEKALALEVLNSIKRAGADFIVSYFGREVEEWLR